MGKGTEQAIRLRGILADRRTQMKLSQQAVADSVARELGKTSLTKQAISQWERFDTQPGIDEFAAWARAVGLRLWVDLYDPDDPRVELRVDPTLVETIERIHDLSPGDRELLLALVRRMSQEQGTVQ